MDNLDGSITIEKPLLLLLTLILSGGSAFTGYAVKTETVGLTKTEIRQILADELKPLEAQVYKTNASVEVIIYRQTEFARRLEKLEAR